MLLDYFSGSLSATQKQEVEEWLNQSEENRKIARDIQYIYLATDTLQTIKGINSDQALVQVKKRIIKPEKTLLCLASKNRCYIGFTFTNQHTLFCSQRRSG